MGGSKTYLPAGGFTEKTYKQIGTTANGIKIIKRKDSNNSAAPAYSNTPHTMYATINMETNTVKQIAVYGGNDGRKRIKDIDAGHDHTNFAEGKPLKKFKKNEIHVHEYDENGRRSNIARKPSKKERRLITMALYGRKSNE